MKKSNNLKIVFIGILAIWLLSYLIHVFESGASFKLTNIKPNDIKAILVEDRGIKGNEVIRIANRDSITQVLALIKTSRLVDWDSINVKANKGLCTIILKHSANTNSTLELINTSFSGAIIESGDYCYRNDSLLHYIQKILK